MVPLPKMTMITFCAPKVYTKDAPLLNSGLLGPVRRCFARRVGL